MAAIHETAYPWFKPYLTAKELDELFSLSVDEIDFINRKTKVNNITSRLGFGILLKCYQYLGRAVQVEQIAQSIKQYVAEQLGIKPTTDLTTYSKSTIKKHKKAIRCYLGLSNNQRERRKIMKQAALEAAKTKEKIERYFVCKNQLQYLEKPLKF